MGTARSDPHSLGAEPRAQLVDRFVPAPLAHETAADERQGVVISLVATNANFYLTTWEEFHTGTLFLSAFSGPVEGILLIIGVFTITGFVGAFARLNLVGNVLIGTSRPTVLGHGCVDRDGAQRDPADRLARNQRPPAERYVLRCSTPAFKLIMNPQTYSCRSRRSH